MGTGKTHWIVNIILVIVIMHPTSVMTEEIISDGSKIQCWNVIVGEYVSRNDTRLPEHLIK